MSLHASSVPVLQHMLGSLKHLLAKAGQHAAAQGYDAQVLTGVRLAPDMFALARQVQIACDMAKNGCARLAQVDFPKFEDDETTLAQLEARIDKTVAFLATLPASAFEGREQADITFPVGRDGSTRTMKGQDFLQLWLLPNFYFHVTTTYALLRHNGVPLGKRDFLLGAAAAQ